MNRANSFSLRSSLAGSARYYPAVTLVLALLALVGYGIYTVQQVRERGMFEYVGIDFRLFYASGQIARDIGLSAVYNPHLQAVYQQPLYEGFSRFVKGVSMPFWALPIPYLPIFVAPFMLLPLLPPLPAFGLWVGLNAGVTLGYLYLWVKRLAFDRTALVAATALFLSIANFLNLLFGQVNVLLLIAIGEALFNLMQKRDGRAGLWLALGWIKPQMILLLVFALLLRRTRRFGAGFLGGSLLIGGVSLALGGWEGLKGVVEVVRHWPSLLRQGGMTWLSAVDHLVLRGVHSTLGLGIGIVMVLVVLLAWLKILYAMGGRDDRETWADFFLATLVTQTIVMPHGNVHMALALGIPWLLVLRHPSREGIWWGLFVIWALLSGIIFVGYGLYSPGHAHDLLGILMLLIHLEILILLYRAWQVKRAFDFSES